jgi:hypothetical protein
LLDGLSLATQAEKLRPGHSCTVDIPDTYKAIIKADLWNGVNVHFPITFDDGVKWLLRVRQLRRLVPPESFMEIITESEVTTLNVLKKAGIAVPDAWMPKDPSCSSRNNTQDHR